MLSTLLRLADEQRLAEADRAMPLPAVCIEKIEEKEDGDGDSKERGRNRGVRVESVEDESAVPDEGEAADEGRIRQRARDQNKDSAQRR